MGLKAGTGWETKILRSQKMVGAGRFELSQAVFVKAWIIHVI
jgi:hypothetical protein